MISRKTDFRLRTGARAGNMYRQGAAGLIYARFRHEGRELRWGSGKVEEAAAREVFWQRFLELAGRPAEGAGPVRRARGVATVGEVVEVYRDKIGTRSNIAPGTVRRNAAALLQVVRMGMGRKPEGVRLDELGEECVQRWRRERRSAAGVAGDGELRHNGSLNSAMQDARSVFSKQALFLFADEGLVVPDLSRFLGVQRLREPRVYWQPIASGVMARMDAAAAGELRAERPAVWVAYELARWAGLRQSEILGARWGWVEAAGPGVCRLAVIHRGPEDPGGAFVPKARDRRVPVRAERVAAWRSVCPGAEGDFIVPGASPTARRDLIQREACAWVAGFLPDRPKRLHELRKQAACEVATRERSIAEAARFLGDTVAVAEKHYAHILGELDPL